MKTVLKNTLALFLWACAAIVCGLIINGKTAHAAGIEGTFTAVHPTRTETSSLCDITIDANTGGKLIAMACAQSSHVIVTFGSNSPLTGIDSGWAYGWYEPPYQSNEPAPKRAHRPTSTGLVHGPTPYVNRSNCDLVDIHIDESGADITVWCP